MRSATIVDGNAIAGMMSDLMVGDATSFRVTCGGCRADAPLAETVVELDAAAAIVRCRSCTMTLFTLLRRGGGARLVIGSVAEIAAG